jgi:pimeloyl-ACP methyl ester carboxylesterase
MGGHSVYFYKNHIQSKPLLFIHGFLDACFGFRRLVPFLNESYSLFLADVPGFGQSKMPVIRYMYQIDIFSELLYQSIQKLNLQGMTIIGHSMGGLIAQKLCLLDTSNKFIEKLVLLSSANSPHPERDRMRRILFPKNLEEMDNLLNLLYQNNKPDISQIAKKAFIQYWNRTEYEFLAENTVEKENSVFIGSLASKINLPCLIIGGSKDPITTPEMLLQIQNYISNSQLVIIPDASHSIHLEKPKEVSEHIHNWIQSY